ncbi:amino acid ABC transporter permease [Pantanalinema rosaneae CENA516]|uniref:amino acid ABC transporter permease n=1 Tax=Pantanalinema rosaneae TaxID=1620701 RepID=UPI003D6FBBF0
MPPTPASSNPVIFWLRKNLFNTWYNSLLTIACLVVIYQVFTGVATWVTTTAQWSVVTTNLRLFLIGRYPADLAWRVGGVAAIVVALMGLWVFQLTLHRSPIKARLRQVMLLLLPIAAGLSLWLIGGGLGLTPVSTNLWGGLLLTLFVSVISIVLAFPLGVLLALGRRGSLPVLRGACTVYIEVIRGLPLIGILFMAQVMLPLVLPGQWRLDRVLRAIAGLVLFNAAYLAENVRGGLQSIPRGQTEAAKALGLNLPQTLILIVLPQALRIAVPSIVGQFISLFKDTSLLSLFALLELTGMGRSILAQPQFLGRNAEVFLFLGLIYWLFCYTMSIVSRRLEQVKSH